jgi:hypothetical protein
MTLFVIGFVWQNVEVVKIKHEYKKLNQIAEELYKERDVLLYKIEQKKNIDLIRERAGAEGYKELRPDNMVIVSVDEDESK